MQRFGAERPISRAMRDSAGAADAWPASPLTSGDQTLRHEWAEDLRANRQLRATYADRAHGLAAGCLVMWTMLLAAQGAIKALSGADLWSDQVIVAVTTGVTVSVLAAFLGVIRGLFPGKDKPADKDA